jgi:hypothetical protein
MACASTSLHNVRRRRAGTTCASIGDTFGAATNVSALNTATDDWAPFIAHDGASMYYKRGASVDGSGSVRAQVWLATRVCQ